MVLLKDKKYSSLPGPVKNGEPWLQERKLGKGQQVDVDAEDFPSLARTGLHSEATFYVFNQLAQPNYFNFNYLNKSISVIWGRPPDFLSNTK